MPRLTPRRILTAAVAGLAAVTALGGWVFGVVEDLAYLDGLWLAFTVVSTTGFGEGPATVPGQLVAMLLFMCAAAAYVVILAVASTYGRLLADERRGLRAASVRDVRQVARELHRN